MKKILLALFALIATTTTIKAQNASINGRITGVDNGKTHLVVSAISGNKIIPYDTATVSGKGDFSFNMATPKPTLFLLNIEGHNQGSLHLMLMPGDNATVNLEYDNNIDFLRIASSEGSNEVDLYRQFNNLMYKFNKSAKAIDEEYSNPATTNQRKQQLGEQFLELQTEQNIAIRNLLNNNSDKLISAFLVTYFDKDIETYYELFETVCNSLKPKYPDNQFVQYVDSKVKSNLGAGRMAPEIAMKDPDGNERKLSNLRGNVVLIDFWASWCRPCRMENPNVVKIYKKYHDKGFEIFSVSLDRERADWVKAIAQDGLEWSNHVSDLRGWTSSGGASYGITSVPSTVLVDRQGRIIARNLRGQQLEMKLKEIFGF